MVEHGRTIKTCSNQSSAKLHGTFWLSSDLQAWDGFAALHAAFGAGLPQGHIKLLMIWWFLIQYIHNVTTVCYRAMLGFCRHSGYEVLSSIEIYRTSMKAQKASKVAPPKLQGLSCAKDSRWAPTSRSPAQQPRATDGNRIDTTCSPCRAWRGADGPKETWSRSHLRPTSTMLARRIDIGMVPIIIMITYVIYCYYMLFYMLFYMFLFISHSNCPRPSCNRKQQKNGWGCLKGEGVPV